MDLKVLEEQNRLFADTKGVSTGNRQHRFIPAFRDEKTGRVEIARFSNGEPAPAHLICGLPEEWAVDRDESGEICRVKGSIIAGFVRDNTFYTRKEAAESPDPGH